MPIIKRYSTNPQRRPLPPRRIREDARPPSLTPEQRELQQLKTDIEKFVLSLDEPALYQDDQKLGLLDDLGFSLGCLGNRLLLTFQLQFKRVTRRILDIRTTERRSLEIQAQHFTASETFVIQPNQDTVPLKHFKQSRKKFQKYLEGLILRNFPKAKISHSTLHTNLEHSLSGRFVRLRFSSGRSQWAALAVNPSEEQATVDAILSNGIIWREYSKSLQAGSVGKLLLLVPANRLLVLKSRLGWIRGAGQEIHLMEMECERDALAFCDLTDSGNIDTMLSKVHILDSKQNYTRNPLYQRVINMAPHHIETRLRSGSNILSFRIRGLEFAQLRLETKTTLAFGVDSPRLLRSASDWQELEELIASILEQRHPAARARRHSHYRIQGERWLESLILQDIQVIDSSLDPQYVYPQVPAFLGGDRGMIDILCLTKQGRLAILELKVSPDIELPVQGLDYWLRVRWHQERQEFARKGYFPNRELSPDPPLLYFVCPQFCYHDTFPRIVRYFDASIPMIQIGLNENWRAGIRVVMRRRLQ